MSEFADAAGGSVDVVAVVGELAIWEKSRENQQTILRMKLTSETPKRNKKSRRLTWKNKQRWRLYFDGWSCWALAE